MKANTTKSKPHEPKMVEREGESCELNLSSDRKWMRLIVDGKLVASFHVNYVNKVLGAQGKSTVDSTDRKSEAAVNM